MASFNASAAEHSTTTFVATPVQLDQSSTGHHHFAGATSHFITTTPPANLHRQTTAVTSNSSSSSYTFLQIKREPCQVSEVTTSNHCHQQQQQQHHHHQQHHQRQQQHHNVCSATSSTSISATSGTTSKTVSASTLTTLVKIEPPSTKVSDMLDKSSAVSAVAATLGGSTNNSVPIGIAVARKRPQESSTLGNCGSTATTIPLSQAINKDLNCFGFRVADFSGVGAGCGNIFFTGNGDLMTTGSTAATSAEEFALSAAGVQNVNRAPSTFWQYPSAAALPFESVISMSPATVGLQYPREANRAAGQVFVLPAATAAALGISNIPPLCYTPTDPFQQAAAAAALVWPSAATAAYIPQGAATPATATLQTPQNFIFPTMNTAAAAHNAAAAAAAATLQPQSYAAAASLQLFGSSYLRNATEFMAAANKTTTTSHQNHLIASAANGAATGTTTLTLPPAPLNATTALSFETRDKTTMTTTTTTNLLELQSNAQALNLMRLPTPPTSATICSGIGGGVGTVNAGIAGGDSNNHHHMTPTQILFQTTTAATAATNSPTPTLLNLSTNGANGVATAANSTAILPRAHSFGAAINQNIGPPTPAGDEPTTTTTPLPLNFKTSGSDEHAAATTVATTNAGAGATLPQMQDVNIQTETPVCSEDENSSCLHTQQSALSNSADACLTPATYNGNSENSEEAVEPLELTKNRTENDEANLNKQPPVMKSNTCHNGVNELCYNDQNDSNSGETMPAEQHEQQQQHVGETHNEASTTNDFAGLELLSNISTSTLAANKPPTTATDNAAFILRVKQEPPDSVEENQQQHQLQQFQHQQQQLLMMPTIAAKLEHPTTTTTTTTTCNNETFESSVQSSLTSLLPPQNQNQPQTQNQSLVQLNTGNETTTMNNSNCNSNLLESLPTLPTVIEAEPMPSGLNLLCALVEQRIQEEEGVQGSSLFSTNTATTTNSSSQRATPLSSYNAFHHQQQQLMQTPPPYHRHIEQSTFPNMDGIELPTTSGSIETATPSPTLLHVKRKKHKHSKSSKSTTSTSSPCSTLLNNGGGIGVGVADGMSPSSMICSIKSSKRCSKKNKKKYSKEKRRQQRAAAAAAAAAELDLSDEQLKLELQKAFMNGGGGASAANNSSGSTNANVKWPTAHEIFNIMESSMRQKLADITRQYRKKKRKLEEISKTQRKKKKCSKLLAQQLQLQLQQQQQQQQQTLQSSSLVTASTLGSSLVAATTTSTTSPLSEYKFSTKFSKSATPTGPQIPSAAAAYLQPSSFPLRFPPQAPSTADEDSDRNSQQQHQQRSHKSRHPIYKPVRLEPSALTAAIVANGNNNNNNHNNNSGIGNNSNNTNTTINDNFSSINVALRLAQQQQQNASNDLTINPLASAAAAISKAERKLKSKLNKTKRRSSDCSSKINTKIESNGINDASPESVSPPKRPRNQIDSELTLTNEHLYRKETRVLTDMGGLFYAGIMKPLQPPDIYAITLDGERGNKPHIMSREEIFKDTILEIAPKSIDCVPVGTRLCAYWSQQYRCLYPGRAIESESSEGDDETAVKDFVSVEFDDGDSGRIRLQNIRLLMSDYPIVEYNDNPLYSLGKQKKTAMKNCSGGAHVGVGEVCSGGGVVQDTNAVLHDTSLGLSALMLGGGDDGDEMYARRTEKKRLKKNPKKKSQQQQQTHSTIVRLSTIGGVAAAATTNTTTTSAADDEANNIVVEHSRKHHKHKKHKKHKKHHRKGASLHDIAAAAATTVAANGFKMTTTSANGGAYESTTEALSSAADNDDEEAKCSSSRLQQPVQLSAAPAVAHKPIKLEADGGVKVKTERIEDVVEEESASNMMSENSDEAKGDEDDDEIEHNNSKGSKIAAFLPERQLWSWQGMAYRRAGVKGRARKQFYKSIKRGKELITVGDCAVFLSTGRPDRPYIGRIESMWETASSNKVVRVHWFYHPEETTGCPKLKYPGALFESPHEDENDVQTISHRCEVLPFERYYEKFGDDAKQYQSIYDNNDTYYLAGYYNPRALMLNLQDDIPTKNVGNLIESTSNKNITDGTASVVGCQQQQQQNTSTGTSIPKE